MISLMFHINYRGRNRKRDSFFLRLCFNSSPTSIYKWVEEYCMWQRLLIMIIWLNRERFVLEIRNWRLRTISEGWSIKWNRNRAIELLIIWFSDNFNSFHYYFVLLVNLYLHSSSFTSPSVSIRCPWSIINIISELTEYPIDLSKRWLFTYGLDSVSWCMVSTFWREHSSCQDQPEIEHGEGNRLVR